MPKFNTFKEFPFTARVWNYTRRTDPTGQPIFTHTFYREIRCSVSQGLFGKITINFGDDAGDVMDQAQLHDLKDKFGNEVYPDGVWTLSGLLPIITPFGTREGYRADAKLTFVDG